MDREELTLKLFSLGYSAADRADYSLSVGGLYTTRGGQQADLLAQLSPFLPQSSIGSNYSTVVLVAFCVLLRSCLEILPDAEAGSL